MVALGRPAIDLVFTGGRFTVTDSRECAAYFAIFSVSMFLWSAQAIYARAFYAAGNTITPAIAGTIVTVVSWPIYLALFHWQGAMGLAIASDIGIAMQTLTIALLLHRGHMVSLASLDYVELGRCLLTGAVSCASAWATVWAVDGMLARFPSMALHLHARGSDVLVLVVGTAVWLAITKVVLEKAGSALPRVAMKRLGMV
jgi:putative peptidoglycan lipid II flippase